MKKQRLARRQRRRRSIPRIYIEMKIEGKNRDKDRRKKERKGGRKDKLLVFFSNRLRLPGIFALSQSEVLRRASGIARSLPPLNQDAVIRGTFET